MARPGRPVSETYQQVCYSGSQSISFSSEAETVGGEDEDDHVPIFSLSKSSMDVVMATGPTHKRDPVWTRTDLRRSSSTNTHSEQNSGTLKQLHPHMWQHIGATNSHQLPLTAQNMDVHSPPALSDRWIVNMQRWSQCSGSTQSRSSTPDTIVWKDRTSRPSSLTQETPFSAAVESSTSKPVSPTTTHSPFNSPQHTPTLPLEDVLISSSSSQLLMNTQQQKDLLVSSATSSPRLPSKQSHTPSPLLSNSPNLLHLTSTEDTDLSESNLFSFTFPSPIASSVSLAEEGASSHPGCLADDVLEELHSPGGTQVTDSGEAEILSYLTAHSPTKGQESEASFCYLELPSQLGQSCLTGQGWRSPLVSSMSDSQLGNCCRCNLKTKEGITRALNVDVFREEGTMTSRLNLVDAAVQTISPLSSLWGLTRNMSSSNMGSHSILGSPPGSRLNLKSSVGSHSNLVSPSSSMFPVSSGEEDERKGDDQMRNSPTLHDLDRRRSCLKIQGEERDEMGRRSSMKQVQWDEDGMTWDVHGASVDPEVLCEAIQKHLDIQSSPQPAKRPSKKKKAPKPPLISNVVKAMTPEINSPVMIMSSTCLVEGEPEETPAGDTEEEEKEGGKKEEIISRADEEKEENAKEEDEVCVEEGTGHPKSPSRGSAHSRKKSVIRSLRRPGWCGGSRKADD